MCIPLWVLVRRLDDGKAIKRDGHPPCRTLSWFSDRTAWYLSLALFTLTGRVMNNWILFYRCFQPSCVQLNSHGRRQEVTEASNSGAWVLSLAAHEKLSQDKKSWQFVEVIFKVQSGLSLCEEITEEKLEAWR